LTGSVETAARQLPLSDYLGLKGAWRDLVQRVGSKARAARISRVRDTQIDRYSSPDEEHLSTFAPIDIVADLEAEAGPLVTRELAALCGYLLVELPAGVEDVTDLGRITGQAMKEVGEVFSTMGQSLDDGVFTSVESTALVREINEAMVMLATLKLRVEAKALWDQSGRERV
jgi:hypothetical protein